MPALTLLDLRVPWDRSEAVLRGPDGRPIDLSPRLIGSSYTGSTDEGCFLEFQIADRERELQAEHGDRLLQLAQTELVITTGGCDWVLSECEKTDVGLGLVAYDAAMGRGKRRHLPRSMKVSRDSHTRAQFMRRMFLDAGIELDAPEINKVVPIQALTAADRKALQQARRSYLEQESERSDRARGTIPRGKHITVKGVRADAEQIRQAERLLAVADREGATGLARLALIVSAIGESSIRAVPNSGGSPYHGVLQGRKDRFGINDTEEMARCFLRGGMGFQGGGAMALAKAHPTWPAGKIALVVEGSVSNFASEAAGVAHYQKHRDEAALIIQARSGGEELDASVSGTPDRAYVERYEFTYSARDTVWERGRSLADEVLWRLFAVGNIVRYANDDTLYSQPARVTLIEGAPGVTSIRWKQNVDGGLDQVTVQARVAPFQLAPGDTVRIEGEGDGVDGKWIVRSFTRDLLREEGAATITLGRKVGAKPEPRSRVVTRPGSDPINTDVTGERGERGAVHVEPNANRPGVPLNPVVIEFLKRVAGITREDVRVGTGTRHNKFTTSGSVSNHWNGNGADLLVGGDARLDPKVGSTGDNIATAILMVCGVDRDEAFRLAHSGALNFSRDFRWNGRTIEVGWRTLEGGNHFNHIHVGVT